MNKLGLGMQWLLGNSTYRPYILSTSTTRAFALAGNDNECVVSLEGWREGGEGMGGDGRGWEGMGGEGRAGEGREGEGRRGMTVIHILMAPQYLNNNHVTYYVIT